MLGFPFEFARQKQARNFVIVGLLLVLLLVLSKARLWIFLTGAVPFWDFDIYYQTAQDALAGMSPYQVPYMQTAGPPLVVVPYLSFTMLSLPVARIVVTLLNVVAAGASCFLLARVISRHWSIELTLSLMITLWVSFPARFSLLLGQPNLVIMLAVTVVLVGMVDWWQPIALTVAALIKTNMVVGWLGLVRQHRSVVLRAGIVLCALAALALPVIKPQFYQEYRDRAHHYVAPAVVLQDVDYYNQSLRSTLARLGLGAVAPAIFIVAAMVGAVYLITSGNTAAGFTLSLLLSPIVWQHYIVVVYPGLVLLAVELIKQKAWNRLSFLALAALALTAEFPSLHGAPLGDWRSLLASHYFLGLVILLVLQLLQNQQTHPSSSRTPTKQ